METLNVVDKTYVRFPGELHNLVFENRDSFAEEFGLKIDALNNSSSFKVYFSKGRAAIKPRALV
jgi:hypothetical protein